MRLSSDKGWVPEPITTDRDIYIRAALAAASTFDTQKSSRDEWLTYLDTWFTPDTRYTSQEDREATCARLSSSCARASCFRRRTGTRSRTRTAGSRHPCPATSPTTPCPMTPRATCSIGTADVVLTFTRSDGNGNETSYDETVRVSVQVLCGEGSVPTPNSAQQPGDCKVVRYFSGSLEP